VSIDWLAANSEQAIRTDPNTYVDTLIENAKLKYGVELPRSKAYRARMKAYSAVIGHQKKQYTRLRDYLNAILVTNPRFHGLFICFNASLQGFLNGCRPFIGNKIVFPYLQCYIVSLFMALMFALF